jgi:uncharacterized Zn finger protein
MYGLNRCPRCGGHRLIRRWVREILVICAGCGLVATVPEVRPPPSAATAGADLAMVRRHQRRLESLICGDQLTPMNHP